MARKSRGRFHFESTTGEGGPIRVRVNAISHLSDDTRDMMVPLLEPAVYLVQRIVGRVRTGKNAEGGSFPKKRDGRPMTFYRSGYMLKNFRPKAMSPTRVSYTFTGKHREMIGRGAGRAFKQRQTGTTKSGRAKYLGNADLARILNSSDRVRVDFHQPSRKEFGEMETLVAALLTPRLIERLGLQEREFQAEKRARKAVADAKKANGKGIKRGM